MHACGRCTNIYRVYVCAYLCVLCACMVWCVCVQVVCVGVCTLRHRSTHPQLSLAHFQLSQQSKQSTSRRVGSSQPHPASLWGPCPEDGTLKFHRCWVPLTGAGCLCPVLGSTPRPATVRNHTISSGRQAFVPSLL